MRRALALLLLMTGPAAAQPRTTPARDVVVTYRVDGPATALVPGGLDGPVRLSWDAGGQRVRAEAEGRSQAAVIDVRAGRGFAIDRSLRVVLPLPLKPGSLAALTMQSGRLTATGRDRVAGLACTTYRVETGRQPGSVCLTEDGVPLRGSGVVEGKQGTFTATAVRYGPVPASAFEAPAGYFSFDGQAGGFDLRSLKLR